MRKYSEAQQSVLSQIICNCCGKEIKQVGVGIWEESFHAEKAWGYLSNQDGRQDSFDLCQDCYEQLVGGFQIKCSE